MTKEEFYKDENLLLEYVAEGNYLHETWWGSTTEPIFEKLLDVIMKALNEKKADGLILDAREHKGLSPKSQELAAKTIGSYATEHGGLKQAIIIPKDAFSKFSVNNYSKKLDEDSKQGIKYFDSIEKAQEWLK